MSATESPPSASSLTLTIENGATFDAAADATAKNRNLATTDILVAVVLLVHYFRICVIELCAYNL